VHSVPMNAMVRNRRVWHPTEAGSAVGTQRPAGHFVRLSQLHKLRECEQVAAVCYRLRGNAIEFLLVRTRGSARWTFPKGKAEPGLTHAQAAAVEAFEEAGVHGRIEEASFARYFRHKGRATRKSSAESSATKLAVNAHLCEVSRLSRPKESNRNRNWFSVEDAKQRLREGRERPDGAEFARVIDRAVVRIEQLCKGTNVTADRSQQDRLRQLARQEDALQKVPFDFMEAYGRVLRGALPANPRRQPEPRQDSFRRRSINTCARPYTAKFSNSIYRDAGQKHWEPEPIEAERHSQALTLTL
jgi:8-oxo-dGTP pyrophosphatase MutT (NUDIX family)